MNKLLQDKARLEGDIFEILHAFMKEHKGLKNIDIEAQFIDNLGENELIGTRVRIEI